MVEKEDQDEIECPYIESVVIIICLEKSRRNYNAPIPSSLSWFNSYETSLNHEMLFCRLKIFNTTLKAKLTIITPHNTLRNFNKCS